MKTLLCLSILASSLLPLSFAQAQHYTQYPIRCESTNNKPVRCEEPHYIKRVRKVTLKQQLSEAPCIEGETFGRLNRGVWVDQGCRGDFILMATYERFL